MQYDRATIELGEQARAALSGPLFEYGLAAIESDYLTALRSATAPTSNEAIAAWHGLRALADLRNRLDVLVQNGDAERRKMVPN